MKTVFHRYSRELENTLFGIIASYIGQHYPEHTLFNFPKHSYQLCLKSTKRRQLGRIKVEKRIKHLVIRKWLVDWDPIYNMRELRTYEMLEQSLKRLKEAERRGLQGFVDKLRSNIYQDFHLKEF